MKEKPKKQTMEEEQINQEVTKAFRNPILTILAGIILIIQTIVKAVFKTVVVCIFIFCYYSYRTLTAFVGTSTNADVSVHESLSLATGSLFEHYTIAIICLIILCILLLIWVFFENYLRRKYVKRLGKMEKERISLVDPNAGTSNITAKGYSNPED